MIQIINFKFQVSVHLLLLINFVFPFRNNFLLRLSFVFLVFVFLVVDMRLKLNYSLKQSYYKDLMQKSTYKIKLKLNFLIKEAICIVVSKTEETLAYKGLIVFSSLVECSVLSLLNPISSSNR